MPFIEKILRQAELNVFGGLGLLSHKIPADAITEFQGDFRPLSNFFPEPFMYRQKLWPTAEHAYQAQKTPDLDMQCKVRLAATPGIAKRMGYQLPLQPDWDGRKRRTMAEILFAKFNQPKMKTFLRKTNPRILIEGNRWKDRFWGVCDSEGENHLGRLLMAIRQALIEDSSEFENGYSSNPLYQFSGPCPQCGTDGWEHFPDSLADFCKNCGFTRVYETEETYTMGSSLQEWAADIHSIHILKRDNS